MKKLTHSLYVFACAVALVMAAPAHAQKDKTPVKASPLSAGTTIVQPFRPNTGVSPADAYKAMQNMSAAVRKVPGLIDEVILENKNPSGQFSHVHVMLWRDQKSWELMAADPAFQKTLRENAHYFSIDSAVIFLPITKK